MSNIGSRASKNDYEFWRNKPSSYKVLSSSGQIKDSDGILTGLFVSSTNGGSFKVWDNTVASTTTLIDTTTASTGVFLLPETYFSTGCYVTITNTATITLFYK